MRGRCTRIVERLLRSTGVPIADLPVPMIKSPSQWPGTARSSASAGRSLRTTSALTWPCALFFDRARGCRNARARAQTGDQFALERTTALDEQRLVDRLVADAHGLIIGEVERQPVRDLLRTPRQRPTPVSPVGLAQALPGRRGRARNDRAVRSADVACEPVLDVLPQPRILHELGGLGSLRGLLCLPLRHPSAVLLLTATAGGVAAQFT